MCWNFVLQCQIQLKSLLYQKSRIHWGIFTHIYKEIHDDIIKRKNFVYVRSTPWSATISFILLLYSVMFVSYKLPISNKSRNGWMKEEKKVWILTSVDHMTALWLIDKIDYNFHDFSQRNWLPRFGLIQ